MTLPPVNRTIILPEEGWEPRTWYQVEVSFNRNNPIHLALLFTGFLNGRDGGPGGYHMLVNPGWEDTQTIDRLHYLKPLQNLGQLTTRKMGDHPDLE